MRAILVMFDTLSRRFLSTYGADWTYTPNFKRLEKQCAVFDNFYAGSLPCMPARRELHTGRYNFFHRGWGPLEPFDFSVFDTLKTKGVYTHLITDHSHYFEDGGATYHNRYNTWEGFRGQEGDRWIPQFRAEKYANKNPRNKQGISVTQHYANRYRITCEEEMPSVRTINAGLDFLDCYKNEDDWLLQIECFDPHEPYYVPQKYRDMYKCVEVENAFFWPRCMTVDDSITQNDIDELQKEYAALITMCDHHLGRILDFMDENNMWEDTLLIVNTDHGFLLGEKDYLGKYFMPQYEEIVHIPFYIHIPGNINYCGRKKQLAQTIDIAPTLLDYFKIRGNNYDMDGTSLLQIVESDKTIHQNVLFGIHGGHANIYDGRYVLMKSPEKKNAPLTSITLMPTNMRGYYHENILKQGVLLQGNRFTNSIPCMKYLMDMSTVPNPVQFGTLLFDLENDPNQENPLNDLEIKKQMCEKLRQEMEKIGVPEEEFIRLGLVT